MGFTFMFVIGSRAGKLREATAEPGLRFRIPLLDTFAAIQVTLQTDKVTNIPCGTKGGVMIFFEKVEVTNCAFWQGQKNPGLAYCHFQIWRFEGGVFASNRNHFILSG